MAEEETPSSSNDDKPFFAIDAEDVAEAAAAATSAAPSSAATPQPPQSIVLGTLNNPNSTAESTFVSGSEGEVKANPLGAATPQLTGDINAMTGQGMFAAPMLVPEAKKKFRWGQFFIGLVAPPLILFVVSVGTGVLEPEYDDFWRYETVELSGQDGTVFEHQVAPASDEFMQHIFTEFGDQGNNYIIQCDTDYYANGAGTNEEFPVFQSSQEGNYAAEIGSFFPSNQTLWFSLWNASTDSLLVEIEYVNEEYYEDDMGFSDGVFCLLPLAFIAGTVAAFVRGNRGLGFGMLTSLGLMVLIPFLFLFFILLAFSGM